ncbi:ERF family protein [Spiribacter onubensis]|uniref:ERF family protein n=1 Tax=Spiribacter onubensis TaxID=3122420 RepID=A0ABV3S784_9GAMM
MDEDTAQQALHHAEMLKHEQDQEANMSSNIAAAFVAAQKEFGKALKSADNPYFKSKYADLQAVSDAVMEPLNKHGIAVIQKTSPSQTGVLVETVFIHESGEQLSAGQLYLPAPKEDPQKYGGALTYARRYALMAACGIAPEDDDGNAASDAIKQEKAKPITADQAVELNALIEEAGSDVTKVCAFFEVDHIENLPAGRYKQAVAMLKKKQKKEAA